MKSTLVLFFLFFFRLAFAQNEDSIPVKYRILEEVRVYKDYYKLYRQALRSIRKVYPMAVFAAKKLREIDKELEQEDSKRKKKKLAKKEHKELKDEFSYVLRDLYFDEGILLMKLIHRESGLTVSDILKKYRGNFNAEVSEIAGRLWEQDLDVKYDPKGEDWVVEQVIQDILSEEVKIDFTPKILSKEEYKKGRKEYRKRKKAAKKIRREQQRSEEEKK